MRYMQPITSNFIGEFECKCVVVSSWIFPSYTVAGIANNLPHALPRLLVLFILRLGKDNGLHAIVEERIRFHEVDDIEGDLHIEWEVAYSEVEPLGVASGVDVILEHKIILRGRTLHHNQQYFECWEQVTRLEVGVELNVPATNFNEVGIVVWCQRQQLFIASQLL